MYVEKEKKLVRYSWLEVTCHSNEKIFSISAENAEVGKETKHVFVFYNPYMLFTILMCHLQL